MPSGTTPIRDRRRSPSRCRSGSCEPEGSTARAAWNAATTTRGAMHPLRGVVRAGPGAVRPEEDLGGAAVQAAVLLQPALTGGGDEVEDVDVGVRDAGEAPPGPAVGRAAGHELHDLEQPARPAARRPRRGPTPPTRRTAPGTSARHAAPGRAVAQPQQLARRSTAGRRRRGRARARPPRRPRGRRSPIPGRSASSCSRYSAAGPRRRRSPTTRPVAPATTISTAIRSRGERVGRRHPQQRLDVDRGGEQRRDRRRQRLARRQRPVARQPAHRGQHPAADAVRPPGRRRPRRSATRPARRAGSRPRRRARGPRRRRGRGRRPAAPGGRGRRSCAAARRRARRPPPRCAAAAPRRGRAGGRRRRPPAAGTARRGPRPSGRRPASGAGEASQRVVRQRERDVALEGGLDVRGRGGARRRGAAGSAAQASAASCMVSATSAVSVGGQLAAEAHRLRGVAEQDAGRGRHREREAAAHRDRRGQRPGRADAALPRLAVPLALQRRDAQVVDAGHDARDVADLLAAHVEGEPGPVGDRYELREVVLAVLDAADDGEHRLDPRVDDRDRQLRLAAEVLDLLLRHHADQRPARDRCRRRRPPGRRPGARGWRTRGAGRSSGDAKKLTAPSHSAPSSAVGGGQDDARAAVQRLRDGVQEQAERAEPVGGDVGEEADDGVAGDHRAGQAGVGGGVVEDVPDDGGALRALPVRRAPELDRADEALAPGPERRLGVEEDVVARRVRALTRRHDVGPDRALRLEAVAQPDPPRRRHRRGVRTAAVRRHATCARRGQGAGRHSSIVPVHGGAAESDVGIRASGDRGRVAHVFRTYPGGGRGGEVDR